MKKILLIIKREYLTRVRKRSFIIMSILGPLLMAAMLIVPVYVAQVSDGETQSVAVLDETGWFYKSFQNTDNIRFEHVFTDLETAKADFFNKDWYALLYIPKPRITVPNAAVLYSDKQPKVHVKAYIKGILEKIVEEHKLEASGIDPDILKSIDTHFNLGTVKIKADGDEEKSYTEVSMVLGIFAGILIYFFIFLFGAQVMRGVIEEKTSRIVEIIVSSVKPFQLMMGKIIGIAMVGLTQFLIWIVFTFAIVTAVTSIYSDKLPQQTIERFSDGNQLYMEPEGVMPTVEEDQMTEVFQAIFSINFGLMVFSFIIYFIGGYLLYGALFAAVGGAVDNETDTQQFMLPITIPLIFGILMAQYVINHPDAELSFWLSIIPFTSPIIMMVRLPFGVPLVDYWLSIGLLILGFLGATWLAGKIYRTGILMYGSKVSYKTLWGWIRQKN